MGYMRHHAIVVTSWKHELLQEAHATAVELGVRDPEVIGQRLWEVSEITPESTNGYRSFFVAPDGSKEGWDTSDRGDVQRTALIQWFQDKAGYLDWVEVSYGGDDYDRVSAERGPFYPDEEVDR
jgi:hypothetical protein